MFEGNLMFIGGLIVWIFGVPFPIPLVFFACAIFCYSLALTM